jgi:hypothetical protein
MNASVTHSQPMAASFSMDAKASSVRYAPRVPLNP